MLGRLLDRFMTVIEIPTGPFIVWRNPARPNWERVSRRRQAASGSRQYEVLERRRDGKWDVVTVFTIRDGGRPRAA